MYSHATQSEDNHQCPLLLPRYIQTAQHRHRHKQDNEVLHNVHRSIREPHGKLVQALPTWYALVPEEANGKAKEDTSKETPYAVQCDKGQHYEADDAEALRGEDAEVLKEDRHFCEGESEVVNPYAGPERLLRGGKPDINIQHCPAVHAPSVK